MADSKVSALTAVGTPAGTDTIMVVQSSTSKKATVSQYLATGSTDNAILRANGTGGATTQGSDITISDPASDGGAATAIDIAMATADGAMRFGASHGSDNGYFLFGRDGLLSRYIQINPKSNPELVSSAALVIQTSAGVGSAPAYLYAEQVVVRDLAAGGGANVGIKQAAAGVLKVTDASTGNGRMQADAFQWLATGSKPAAGSSYRGMIWYTPGGAGVADSIEICAKSAADTYSWVKLSTLIV